MEGGGSPEPSPSRTPGPVVLAELGEGADRLRLRRARREDLPAVVRLLAADALGAAREEYADTLPEEYERAFAAIDRDPAQLLVVGEDDGGAIVATLQLTVIPGLSRRGAARMQVEGVRLDARLRGRGIGAALFAWVVEEAHRRGCRTVQLTTDRSRTDAHRFYERLGFAASHVGMKHDLDPAPPPPPRS